MKLKMKLVGNALAAMPNVEPMPINLEPFSIVPGDLVTHPISPQCALICVARHIDLVKREVEVYLDFAPEVDGKSPMH